MERMAQSLLSFTTEEQRFCRHKWVYGDTRSTPAVVMLKAPLQMVAVLMAQCHSLPMEVPVRLRRGWIVGGMREGGGETGECLCGEKSRHELGGRSGYWQHQCIPGTYPHSLLFPLPYALWFYAGKIAGADPRSPIWMQMSPYHEDCHPYIGWIV